MAQTQIESPSRRPSPAFHPYCVATFAVTSLYAANFRETPLLDIAAPLFVTILLAFLVVSLLRPIYKDRHCAAIAASFVLALTLFHNPLNSGVEKLYVELAGGFMRYRHALLGWACVGLLSLTVLWFWKSSCSKATQALNLFSVFLLLTSCYPIGLVVFASKDPKSSTPAGRNDELQRLKLASNGTQRDIYYLVFDRYADAETLRRDFDFDNGSFYQELKSRGFHIAMHSRANYPSTALSMSSTLNMKYHGSHVSTAEPVGNHVVGAALSAQGYKYYHLGNLLTDLRSSQLADVNYRVSPLPSEFADAQYQASLLGRLAPVRGTFQHALAQLNAVEALARGEEKKFVYAHFLLPHPPYLFDKDGSPVSHVQRVSRSEAENYRNQLIFTNGRILRIVDTILASSATSPIIVIQSDEGPWLFAEDGEIPRAEAIRRRTGILSAFFLPEVDMSKEIPQTITPVNTFRLIFRKYFDAQLETLDDRVFFWEFSTPWGAPDKTRPNRLVDVTRSLMSSQVETQESNANPSTMSK